MTSVPPVADAVTKLAGTFSGQLLQPADAGYEEARKVWFIIAAANMWIGVSRAGYSVC